MRRTLRLLASVKPMRYLEGYTPTGLTGLLTHPAPQSTLSYLYLSTLEKLKQLPESSVYRQATEALTTNRLKIVESVVPEGHEEWATKASKIIAEHPEVFNTPKGEVDHDGGRHVKESIAGQDFVITKVEKEYDDTTDEWDGEEDLGPELEGTRTFEEKKDLAILGLKRPGQDEKQIKLDPEPLLNADQISEIENKIGAGLIEEVIQVAEGELKLVDIMIKAKAWEDLEEKPAEGQWTYFMRDTATPKTQTPPQGQTK